MTFQNPILFLLFPLLLSSCLNMIGNKKYSITVYITSYDSADKSLGIIGNKIKYSYEEYNSDSNLIYSESYASALGDKNDWGKLYQKTNFFYNGKQKIKAEIEGGTPSKKEGGWSDKYTQTYSYEYVEGQLTRWFINKKIYEEYKYNSQKELIGRRKYFLAGDSSKYVDVRYTYSNGFKIKSEYFPADTVNTSVETFIYKNNKLIEEDSYNGKGGMTEHRVIIRDETGRKISEKWKWPYLDWRKGKDGKWINAEFNQGNKYFYDGKGRVLKTEYYRLDEYYSSDILKTKYEYKYD